MLGRAALPARLALTACAGREDGHARRAARRSPRRSEGLGRRGGGGARGREVGAQVRWRHVSLLRHELRCRVAHACGGGEETRTGRRRGEAEEGKVDSGAGRQGARVVRCGGGWRETASCARAHRSCMHGHGRAEPATGRHPSAR